MHPAVAAFRIIKAVALAIALPFRIAAFALEAAVAAAMVGVMAVGAAWWLNWIPDERVAAFLGQLGARGLNVLTKSGVL